MIVMGMAVQEILDIANPKTERTNISLNERSSLGKSTIQNDQTAGRRDKKGRDAMGTDVVNVADDPERRYGSIPFPSLMVAVLGGRIESSQYEQAGSSEHETANESTNPEVKVHVTERIACGASQPQISTSPVWAVSYPAIVSSFL